MEAQKHNVVIVGGGVGGLRVASVLSHKSAYEVSLISKKKTFDHNTSLYRSKKGRSRRHISLPLSRIFNSRRHGIDLVRASIVSIDPSRQVVVSSKNVEYPYDSLVVALEGENRVPRGIDAQLAHNAYSAGEMAELRRSLIAEFETGQPEGNYLVVGGGQSGVEIAYELKMHMDSLAKRHKRDKQAYQVVLVEGSSGLLARSFPGVGKKIYKRLLKKGVHVMLDKEVTHMQKGRVQFASGQTMHVKQVVLAAGRRANHFFADNHNVFLLGEGGFVRVNSLQEAEGYNNIYIVGNSKEAEHELNTDGKLYDADYVAKILECKRTGHEIPEYEPPSFRARIQLGKTWGVFESEDHAFYGKPGWLLKRWLDRNHFSTLLPTRLWFGAWVRGTKHDEIN